MIDEQKLWMAIFVLCALSFLLGLSVAYMLLVML